MLRPYGDKVSSSTSTGPDKPRCRSSTWKPLIFSSPALATIRKLYPRNVLGYDVVRASP